MICNPPADLFDIFVIILTKFFEVDLFQMVFGFLRTEMILPGTRKEFIQVVVQVPVDQHIPLIRVEPDPITVATTVNVKIGIRKDFITSHDMPTGSAQFYFLYLP